MDKSIDAIRKESDDPCKMGFIISGLIILASILPTISWSSFSLKNENTLIYLFIGLSLFFFTFGFRINLIEDVNYHKGNYVHSQKLRVRFNRIELNDFSLICFIISGLFLLLGLIILFIHLP